MSSRPRRRLTLFRFCSAVLACFVLSAWASAQDIKPGAAPPQTSGDPRAPVTIEIFNDYQCPACALMNEEVKEAESKYQGRVRIIFRNFPLSFHKNAAAAAEAAEAAGMQGKFREMLEILYARQRLWANAASTDKIFDSYAKELRLDLRAFRSDRTGEKVSERIRLDVERAFSLNVKGTPTLLVNGEELPAMPNVSVIEDAIGKALGMSPARP